MPKFDFKCTICDGERTDVTVSNWTSATGAQMPIHCPNCGAQMEKKAAAPNFNVKGFNAKNHYGVKHES